jgi:aspartyl-tRNA(Asn)/glutamyl-tRNA(Gln) amidotransferase subunit A
MENLAFATIAQLQQLLKSKKISSAELLEFFIKRFETHDAKIKSALEIFDKESILTNSSRDGVLAGIPGIIKDNICQKGRITSCASKILSNYRAPYDATAIVRLKDVSAPIIGRANCDEFAMGSSTETSAFQKTYNPWNLKKVPGGSSGGSVAAVAAGLVPWALGSETGGSVRLPAAFCGVVGLKPTYGLVSRYGLVAYASSLDQIGVTARTVQDTATVFSVIAGFDANDATTLAVKPKDDTQALSAGIKKGLKIGILENAMYAQGIDPEVTAAVERAIKQLENLGAKITKIKIPSMDYSAAVYFILSRAEAASNLARFDGVRYGIRDKTAKTLAAMYADTREKGFGAEVKARILVGNYVLSAGNAGEFYENARKVQQIMRQEFAQAFTNVDLLVAPTHPAAAFDIGAFDKDKLQMDLQDYFTCAMNIVGIPAISIPCGFTKSKLPIGFQLIGPHLSEELLFQTAHAYEEKTQWHTMHPTNFL